MTHLAAVAEVVRHFQDHAAELQIPLPFILHGLIARQRAQDIAAHRAGGVAVAPVVDRNGQALGKIILIPQGAVYGDGQGLLGHPALPEAVDVLQVRPVRDRQVYRLVDQFLQRFQVPVPGEHLRGRVHGLEHDLPQGRLRFPEYEAVCANTAAGI